LSAPAADVAQPPEQRDGSVELPAAVIVQRLHAGDHQGVDAVPDRQQLGHLAARQGQLDVVKPGVEVPKHRPPC